MRGSGEVPTHPRGPGATLRCPDRPSNKKKRYIPKQATAPEQDPLTSTDTQPSSTFLDTQIRNNYSILKLLKSSNTSLA